jgi:hypothetical protein
MWSSYHFLYYKLWSSRTKMIHKIKIQKILVWWIVWFDFYWFKLCLLIELWSDMRLMWSLYHFLFDKLWSSRTAMIHKIKMQKILVWWIVWFDFCWFKLCLLIEFWFGLRLMWSSCHFEFYKLRSSRTAMIHKIKIQKILVLRKNIFLTSVIIFSGSWGQFLWTENFALHLSSKMLHMCSLIYSVTPSLYRRVVNKKCEIPQHYKSWSHCVSFHVSSSYRLLILCHVWSLPVSTYEYNN